MASPIHCSLQIKHDENPITAALKNKEVAERLQSIQALQGYLKKRIEIILPHSEHINSYLGEQANLTETDGVIELKFDSEIPTETLKEEYLKLLRSTQILKELERNSTESKNELKVKERKEESLITKLYHTIHHEIEDCAEISEEDLISCLKSGNVTKNDGIKERVTALTIDKVRDQDGNRRSETENQWSELFESQSYKKIIKNIEKLDMRSTQGEHNNNTNLLEEYRESINSGEAISEEYLNKIETQLGLSIPLNPESELQNLIGLKKEIEMIKMIIERMDPETKPTEKTRTNKKAKRISESQLAEVRKEITKLYINMLAVISITLIATLAMYGLSKETSMTDSTDSKEKTGKKIKSAREEIEEITEEFRKVIGGHSIEEALHEMQGQIQKGERPENSSDLRTKFKLSKQLTDACQRIFPLSELKLHMGNAMKNKQVHNWKIYQSTESNRVLLFHTNRVGEEEKAIPHTDSIQRNPLLHTATSFSYKGKEIFKLEREIGNTFYSRCQRTRDGYMIDIAKVNKYLNNSLVTFSSYSASLSQDEKTIRITAKDILGLKETTIDCQRDLKNNDKFSEIEVLEIIIWRDLFGKFRNPKY